MRNNSLFMSFAPTNRLSKYTLLILTCFLVTGCSSVQWREGSVLSGSGQESQDEIQPAENEAITADQDEAETNTPAADKPETAEAAGKEDTAADEPAPELSSRREQRELTPPPYPAADQSADALYLTNQLKTILTSPLDSATKIRQLEMLQENHPSSSGILYHLGRIAFQEDRPMEAVTYLEEAISATPENFYAHNLLGLVFRSVGDFDAARKHYRQAVKIWPDYATAWYNLGILADLYQNQLDEAIIAYENYLAIEASKSTYQQQQAGRAGNTEIPKSKTIQTVELWLKDLKMRQQTGG